MDLLDPDMDVLEAAETVPLDTLRDALIGGAASISAAQARMAQALSVFRARGGAQAGSGFTSFGQWASVDLGATARSASVLADAGDGLADSPDVRAAWESGTLSTAKATCVLGVATPATQADWCALALEASATQLARIASAYRRSERSDQDAGRAAEDREAACGVWWENRDDGLCQLLAVLTPDDAAVVRAALETEAEKQWRAGEHEPGAGHGTDSSDGRPRMAPRPTAARRADALVGLAATGLAAGPIPIVRGEHTEVVLHVDEAFLAGRADTGRCRLSHGPDLFAADAQRLACDARIRAMLKGADGTTVDLGRSQRLVSNRQRRLLRERDHGCRFPGCGNSRYVDAHHVVAWPDGGRTDMANLILLCNRHHRLLHHGAFAIEADGTEGFTFFDRFGRRIGPPGARARHRWREVDGRPRARSGGDPRYSLDLAVSAMASAAAAPGCENPLGV